jgi:hypothetical protein
MAVDPNTLPFEQWIKDAISQLVLNTSSAEEMDLWLLCWKPLQCATRYLQMKAFENHFRVDDPTTTCLQIYDAGMASIFHVPIEDARELSINYVGILKDILKLNYGPLHIPTIMMNCEWMKRVGNRGNNTYTRDEARFLVVNFCHKLPRMATLLSFQVRLPKSFSLIFQINQIGRWFYGKRPTPYNGCIHNNYIESIRSQYSN